jgi:hypothetical protein
MKITDVKTVLMTGPTTNDPYIRESRATRSAAYIEIYNDTELVGLVLPPGGPGLGIVLTEETKNRYPFRPGTGEFNSVPGKQLIL